jgi:hypothetical protein
VLRVYWCLALLSVLTLVGAGCGGSKAVVRPVVSTPNGSGALPRCSVDTERARRALNRLRADIARIRHARTHAQTSAATDRFINDFNHSTLSLVTKNRLIDHAISGTLGKCGDCFQALEPMHTKPTLGMHGCR